MADGGRDNALRPQGWSSFTHRFRSIAPPDDPFPPLSSKISLPIHGTPISRSSRAIEQTTPMDETRADGAWRRSSVAQNGVQSLALSRDRRREHHQAIEPSNSPDFEVFPSCYRSAGNLSDNVPSTSTGERGPANEVAFFERGGDRLVNLLKIPAEPEWHQDDIYLRYRSKALRLARARHRLLHAAALAYNQGQHSMAKELSKKAHENYSMAEMLNSEAAAAILQVRNGDSDRDVWYLDLHGLHSAEAVAALHERLCHLESGLRRASNAEMPSPQSKHQFEKVEGIAINALLTDATGACRSVWVADKNSLQEYHQYTDFRSLSTKQHELSVVTGVGVHSRGGASLPPAVRNYLLNNSYHFREARPGVISVRPKLQFVAS